jgi:hypothetical protein
MYTAAPLLLGCVPAPAAAAVLAGRAPARPVSTLEFAWEQGLLITGHEGGEVRVGVWLYLSLVFAAAWSQNLTAEGKAVFRLPSRQPSSTTPKRNATGPSLPVQRAPPLHRRSPLRVRWRRRRQRRQPPQPAPRLPAAAAEPGPLGRHHHQQLQPVVQVRGRLRQGGEREPGGPVKAGDLVAAGRAGGLDLFLLAAPAACK